MPPVLLAIWPLLLTLLQTFVSYLVGRGVFESLLLVGLRKYCVRWPNRTVIELTIAWADAVGKRHLLGDLQLPAEPVAPHVRPPHPWPRPADYHGDPDRGQGGRIAPALVVALLCLAAGLLVGYHLGVRSGQPSAVVHAQAAPAVVLPDGAVQLESRPAAKPTTRIETPKGATITASGKVVVRPQKTVRSAKDAGSAMDGATDGPICECAPVTIDYALYTTPEGQPHMAVRPQGGELVDGLHRPAQLLPGPRVRPWAVGPSYGLADEGGDWGVAITRQWPAFQAGADLFSADGHLAGRASLQIRF